jgi:hypothetical protein
MKMPSSLRLATTLFVGTTSVIVPGLARQATLRSRVEPLSFPDVAAGQEATIRFHVIAGTGITSLSVEAYALDNLKLLDSDGRKECASLTAGGACEYVASVRLSDAPAGMLGVEVGESGGGYRATMVVPLRIGKLAAKPRDVHVGTDQELANLMLLNSNGSVAVIRFEGQPLAVVQLGDKLGRTGAVLMEVRAGAIVLEETVRKGSGSERVRILLQRGEKGGKRIELSPAEEDGTVRKPGTVGAEGEKDTEPPK